ncbi:hypothetical protein PGIGA_G00009180 [Pangasianodon gigas]|uniref:Uncharacterized protein n=1 Tax=Pangasianodon gigas TaxID=30993 RepID=A0ACC5W6I0_PANGG|nr:hypothetical protein [Pangasianodon gigas]
MKFVVFLLVFTAMVGFNAFCQEVIDSQVSDTNLAASSGDAVRPADAISHNRSTMQRSAYCACPGTSKRQRRCQCKMPFLRDTSNGLSHEKKALCLKKGIQSYKKCKNLKVVKNKVENISTPI